MKRGGCRAGRQRLAGINDNSRCRFARRFHTDRLVITPTPSRGRARALLRCIHSRRRQRNIFSPPATINPLSRLRFMTDTSYFNRRTNRPGGKNDEQRGRNNATGQLTFEDRTRPCLPFFRAEPRGGMICLDIEDAARRGAFRAEARARLISSERREEEGKRETKEEKMSGNHRIVPACAFHANTSVVDRETFG